MSEPLKLTESERLLARAKELIPGGMMGIRRPYNFVPGEYPVFFTHGKGGHVFDVDGNEYIDFLCGYGPIILGYQEKEVDEAVIAHIRRVGPGCFSLVQPIQNELAEKVRECIPAAEQCVFMKTGSDATNLAVRVARGRTGRTKVIRCGYHGWGDWCVEVKGGVPQKLWEDTFEFHYNDLCELEDLMRRIGDETACVIVTPVGHPLAHPVQAPSPGFLEGVRELTYKYGAVLVFDEIRSGFRVSLGGAGAWYGVKPDLACVGKAMANGYAISALVGVRDVMRVLEKEVFVSSTYFPNSLEMVAALKTIEILERDRVLDQIREKGQRFLDRLHQVITESGVLAQVSGIPQMPFITFPEDPKDPAKTYRARRTRFYTEVIRRHVFLQPYHHGYICFRHTDADLDAAVTAVAEALAEVKREFGG